VQSNRFAGAWGTAQIVNTLALTNATDPTGRGHLDASVSMTMKVLLFAAMSLTAFAPRFAQSTDIETQARLPAVQTAPVPAEVPGGCNTPAGERTAEVGCYLDATELLGELPQVPLFWHLYNYPTRAAAEAAKGPRGTVVESFERVWLYTIAEAGWHPSSGARVAVIGPLSTDAGKQYTARYMEAFSGLACRRAPISIRDPRHGIWCPVLNAWKHQRALRLRTRATAPWYVRVRP